PRFRPAPSPAPSPRPSWAACPPSHPRRTRKHSSPTSSLFASEQLHPSSRSISVSPTHTVLNQAAPRVDVNEFTANTALVESVAKFAPAADTAKLEEIGRVVGTAGYQRDAEIANTITPVHHSHDRWGNRVDDVEFHPSYH